MTDEIQRPISGGLESPSVVSEDVPLQPTSSNKKILLIVGVVIAVICLCLIVCIILSATGLGKVMKEKAPIEAILDAYMRDMETKDLEGAYELYSPRVQRRMPLADLEEMIQGNNYVLFEGYQSLSVQNLNIRATANTNKDLPQGTVATVDGIITYEGGITGELYAVLEKVEGAWKIHFIRVIVPPDKFQPSTYYHWWLPMDVFS
jgi:hypothetical protein